MHGLSLSLSAHFFMDHAQISLSLFLCCKNERHLSEYVLQKWMDLFLQYYIATFLRHNAAAALLDMAVEVEVVAVVVVVAAVAKRPTVKWTNILGGILLKVS